MTVPEKYIKTKADRQAVEEGCYFDQEAADRVVRFIETYLTLSKGFKAGHPFKLLDWQKHQVIYPLFGWKRPDGTRRFRTAYIQVSKKNGKTVLTSAIATYMLVADGEESPLVVSAACTRDQASMIFQELAHYIRHNQKLRDALHVRDSRKEIYYPKKAGYYKALSADAASKEGLDCSCVLVDELHAHPSPALYNSLKYATISRKQPLFIVITTAGEDRTSVCYELYKYSKGILDGTNTDTSFYPLVYEADEDCDVLDEGQWHKANPSLGITQTVDSFKEDAAAAKYSKMAELKFRRYRLNQWVSGLTSFLNIDAWDACQGFIPNLKGKGKPIYLALDLASTTDLAAMVGIVPDQGKYYVLHWAWCPEEGVKKRENTNLTKYRQFQAEGSLTITQGNACDYGLIRKNINDLRHEYQVKEIVMDKWNALYLAEQLTQDGFNVLSMPQTTTYMNDPLKQLEKAILDKKLVHDGSTLLRWQCQNMSIEQDGNGNIKPSKKRSVDKIDSMVAVVMAMGRAVNHENNGAVRKSVYDNRGLALV